MSGLIIVANIDSLGEAAGELAAGISRAPGGHGIPSFGEPGADDAVAIFAGAVQGYAQRLAASAGDGASSLRGYAAGFTEAGG